MPGIHINVLAVVASALGAFVLGAFWYSPLLFGNLWVKAHGFKEDQVREMQRTAGRAYSTAMACYVVMGVVFSVVFSYMGGQGLVSGLWVGFLIWMGFLLPTGLMTTMFSGRSIRGYLIDTGYQLTYLLIMGTILSSWV